MPLPQPTSSLVARRAAWYHWAAGRAVPQDMTSLSSIGGESVTIQYDPEADAAYIRFSNETVSRTQEESDVCILDLDAAGGLIGIELLSVFGFAGAALSQLVSKGVVTRQTANHALQELKRELVAA